MIDFRMIDQALKVARKMVKLKTERGFNFGKYDFIVLLLTSSSNVSSFVFAQLT